jgi:hypothetical protein
MPGESTSDHKKTRDASIEKFRKNHERGSRVKFHCLRTRRIGGDEFGILLGFTANDPKFFLLAIFAQLFLKKLQKSIAQTASIKKRFKQKAFFLIHLNPRLSTS